MFGTHQRRFVPNASKTGSATTRNQNANRRRITADS